MSYSHIVRIAVVSESAQGHEYIFADLKVNYVLFPPKEHALVCSHYTTQPTSKLPCLAGLCIYKVDY